jgi:trehalose 6-phosphate synthase
LSKYAGAAEQMQDALIINPFSREETSEALGQALAMPKAERVARWKRLMDGVTRDDVSAWRDRFVADLGGDVEVVTAPGGDRRKAS